MTSVKRGFAFRSSIWQYIYSVEIEKREIGKSL